MKLYEAIILLLLGAIGLYRGITNKGGALWSSFRGTGFGKKLMGDDYTRMINILAGGVWEKMNLGILSPKGSLCKMGLSPIEA
jgi:hypothetical protein